MAEETRPFMTYATTDAMVSFAYVIRAKEVTEQLGKKKVRRTVSHERGVYVKLRGDDNCIYHVESTLDDFIEDLEEDGIIFAFTKYEDGRNPLEKQYNLDFRPTTGIFRLSYFLVPSPQLLETLRRIASHIRRFADDCEALGRSPSGGEPTP